MKSLEIGECLRLSSGETAKVRTLERNPGEFWVYNFEVQQYHNYYVTAHRSDPGILVHNQGCHSRTKRELKNRQRKRTTSHLRKKRDKKLVEASGKKSRFYHGTDDCSARKIRKGVQAVGEDPNFHMTIHRQKAVNYSKARAAEVGRKPEVVEIEISESTYLDLWSQRKIVHGFGPGNVQVLPRGMKDFNKLSRRR